jgi:hypothetical protein
MSKNTNASLAPFDPSLGLPDKRIPIIDVAKACSRRIGIKIPPSKETEISKSVKDILKFAWVPADKVYINYERQRWPEPKHINKLYHKWDINCVTPLQCRYDPVEDRYYGSDGQQHIIAWLIYYGLLTEVPCFYVESTDPSIESKQVLALNNDNEPMAKFFIHKQNIKMGDKKAIAIENSVTNSNCETAYKKRAPGCITHISHLYDCSDSYGNGPLTFVLARYREYWPEDKIAEPTVMGFLKAREILIEEDAYTDSVFKDLFYEASQRFESGKDLHLSINRAFERTYPTNYKGMGVREKQASGIISIYEQAKGKKLASKPFEITIPIIMDAEDLNFEDTEDETVS